MMDREFEKTLKSLPKGKRNGGEPENEEEHFYLCAACEQAVDMRDLYQVFHHEEKNHEPIPYDA